MRALERCAFGLHTYGGEEITSRSRSKAIGGLGSLLLLSSVSRQPIIPAPTVVLPRPVVLQIRYLLGANP